MKISSFDKLTKLTQSISANTTGELSTHLGNNVNYPIDSGIEMFNNAMSQIDTYGNNTINESREFEKGEHAYNVSDIAEFIPFLEKVHKARIKKLNNVSVDEADNPAYAGIIPSMGSPVDGDIGINDTNIGYSSTGINFLNKYRNQLRATALKLYPESDVNKLLKTIVGLVREFDITKEGSLIQIIKDKLNSGEIDTFSKSTNIRNNEIQYYVNKAMQQIVCDHDPEEIESGYESLSGWATEKVTPHNMPQNIEDAGGNADIITKDDVQNKIIKEFETGGVNVDNIETLKHLYCTQPDVDIHGNPIE